VDEFLNKLENTLNLVNKNEIDPLNISIGILIDEFFLNLRKGDLRNLIDYIEALLLISLLIFIKISRILPLREKEEEIFEVLSDIKEEDEKINIITNFLIERKNLFENLFKREVNFEELEECDPFYLYKIFEEIISRINEEEVIISDIPKIEEKINEIIERLKEKGVLKFREIFEKCKRKIEVIVYFLAILELLKNKRIKVIQKGIFSEIYIYLR
jgi:segregation and condensation protein A